LLVILSINNATYVTYSEKKAIDLSTKENEMNILRRAVMAIGSMTVVALFIALAAPKAVHGIVATLVRDVDNPGRATIELIQCEALTHSLGSLSCSPTFTVPAGQRFVMEQVEANCGTSGGNSLTNASLSFTEGGVSAAHPFPLSNQGTNFAGDENLILNQAVRYYVDAGSTFSFAGFTDSFTGAACAVYVSGHLISYP
jgi:hypothetical protein